MLIVLASWVRYSGAGGLPRHDQRVDDRAAVRVDDHRVQVDFGELVAERGASAEKRAAAGRNRRSRAACDGAGRRAAAQCAADRSARAASAGTERRQRIHHVGERFHVHAARDREDDGPNCASWTMPSSISTPRALDHRRDQHPRVRCASQDRARRS